MRDPTLYSSASTSPASRLAASVAVSCCCLTSFAFGKDEQRREFDMVAFDRFMEQHLERTGIPGMSIAITQDSTVILVKGYGNDGSDAPMTARTPMLIGSLSKAFTALAILQLVERDRIELDKPVTTYLSDFALKDLRYSRITVRQLLNHTSGMADRKFFGWSRPGSMQISEAVVDLREAELAANPGVEFNYHNPNYAVAARVVEVVSGQRFDRYLQKQVFEPLRMSDSFVVNRLDEADDRVPLGHVFIFGRSFPLSNPTFFLGGSGGVISTAADMAKWLQFLERGGVGPDGGRLITQEAISMMYTASAPNSDYGLGWIDGSKESPPRVYHLGVTPTFTAFQSVSLEGGTSFAILSNGARTLVRGAGASYIQFAIPSVEQGHQPESFGVSSREVDMPLLFLVSLLPLVALVHWKRIWRAPRPTWASSSIAIMIWGSLLLAIMWFPSIAFQWMGGRTASWNVWLEPSAWLWIFYSSPMAVAFCFVTALCSLTMLLTTLVRHLVGISAPGASA